MRTEQDLRAALAAREDLAPDPDSVLAGTAEATVHHRRRRTIGAVAATAAVVAAVVTVPVVLASGPSAEPEPRLPAAPPVEPPPLVPYDPATEPRPDFSFTIYPATVAGYRIEPSSVTPDYQIADIRRPGAAEPSAVLVVYDPDSRSVVGGFFEDPNWNGDPETWPSTPPTHRWEYIEGAEAEMTIDFGPALDEPTVQAIADGLRFTAPYPARLPYRLDYLPAGMQPRNLAQFTAQPGAFRSVLDLGSDSLLIDITVSEDPIAENPDWDWQPTTVAGYPAHCANLMDGTRCAVEIGSLSVDIGFGRLGEDELARIVTGLHPATWEDPSTWYTLDQALP
jgi:hypothetical protein